MYLRDGYARKRLPPIAGATVGRRYYNPGMGRWLNRDPLGELPGVHLYGFVLNDPVSWVDPLGLASYIDCSAGTWVLKTATAAVWFPGRPWCFTMCKCDYAIDCKKVTGVWRSHTRTTSGGRATGSRGTVVIPGRKVTTWTWVNTGPPTTAKRTAKTSNGPHGGRLSAAACAGLCTPPLKKPSTPRPKHPKHP